MEPRPLAETVRSKTWRWYCALLGLGMAFAFHGAIRDMVGIWFSEPDYSHGVLVPLVAAFILYRRRKQLPPLIEWPNPWGLVPVAVGVVLSSAAGTFNIAKEFGQGLGLILALTGCVLLLLGRPGLKWAWPGLLFLIFMVKLPDRLEVQFTFKLRQIATDASNFLLQTLGYPSYISGPGGTVITVGDVRLGVEWACSGLSMVLTFVAMGAAFAMLLSKRSIWDRLILFAVSIPIAILSNIIRITLTAIVYIAADNQENIWKWLGDVIVHDLAGWLMMPMAMGFLWLTLKLIDCLMIEVPLPERDEVLREVTATAAAQWIVPDRSGPDDPKLAPNQQKPSKPPNAEDGR